MTATTTTRSLRGQLDLGGVILAIALGFGLLFVAGLSQASIAHDSAHDVRHAMAFPCH